MRTIPLYKPEMAFKGLCCLWERRACQSCKASFFRSHHRTNTCSVWKKQMVTLGKTKWHKIHLTVWCACFCRASNNTHRETCQVGYTVTVCQGALTSPLRSIQPDHQCWKFATSIFKRYTRLLCLRLSTLNRQDESWKELLAALHY